MMHTTKPFTSYTHLDSVFIQFSKKAKLVTLCHHLGKARVNIHYVTSVLPETANLLVSPFFPKPREGSKTSCFRDDDGSQEGMEGSDTLRRKHRTGSLKGTIKRVFGKRKFSKDSAILNFFIYFLI